MPPCRVSTAVPRTKPEMMRPPEMQSSMAISSAMRTGSLTAMTLPRMGDLGVAGHLGDHRRVDVDGGLHAPVRGVVLVGHDAVEAVVIGPRVLLVVLVIEDVGLLGVEVRVGEIQAPRLVL